MERSAIALSIPKHHHEATIHVILLMAVKECSPRIIGGEFHFGCASGTDQRDVLIQPPHLGTTVHPAHFKSVSMEMHRMVVHAEVLQDKSITLTSLQDRLIGVRIRLTVDSP